MRRFFLLPVNDVLAGLESMVKVKSPFKALAPPMISIGIVWFLYVPIHELLHVLGCVITGGQVDRLEMSPIYGTALYAKIFPFIHSGSDYAGQLTGFDTNGSDFCYFVTDFMPYVLSILFGVVCLKVSRRRRRPFLFGLGVVIGLAPFYNIPGDYYEMGSTITTRVVTTLGGSAPKLIHKPQDETISLESDDSVSEDSHASEEIIAYEGIRSDDVFKLWSEVFTKPGELGLHGSGAIATGVVLIILSMILSVLLAFCTYWLGHFVALLLVRNPAGGNANTASR